MNFNPTLKRFSRRVRVLRAWLGLGMGLSIGAILATGWALLDWLNVFYTEWSSLAYLVGGAGLLGLLVGTMRRIPAKTLTDSIDRRADLKNRLSTATERSGEHGTFDDALQADANGRLENLRPANLYPIKLSRWHAGSLVFSLLAACLFMLGNTPLLLSKEAKASREKMQEQASQIERVVRPLEEEVKKGDANAEEKKLAEELKKLSQELKKARINPEEAMRRQNELNKQAEKLETQRFKKAQENREVAQAKLEQLALELAKKDDASNLDAMKAQEEMLKNLQEQNDSLQNKMNSLESQLNDPSLSKEQKQALRNLLDQMKLTQQQSGALSMQMQQQMSKELQKQLQQMEEEISELQKEIDAINEQLKDKSLSSSERAILMKKLAALNKKLKQSIEMTENMRKAMEKMMNDPLMKEILELAAKAEIVMNKAKNSQGNEEQQALTKEELEEIQKQIDELAKKILEDDEFMKQYLEALRDMLKDGKIGMCSGSCNLSIPFGIKLPIPGVGGPSKDNFFSNTGLINKGSGQDSKGSTFSTAVSGQSRDVPGQSMYIEMRGPTGQGLRTSVQYKKVLPSYKQKADQAMNRQEIPPEHQKRVKKYFESLGQ
jgi:hypothetical protein